MRWCLLVMLLFIVFAVPLLAYDPPVGIPNPEDYFEGFDPIEDKAPQEPSNWNHDIDGWYYVDNTASNASDEGNGNRAVPRKTIPTELSAGDVVVIEGGPYNDRLVFSNIRGTHNSPVWIRGLNQRQKIIISVPENHYHVDISDCSYIIFENIILDGSSQDILGNSRKSGAIHIGEDSDHIVFRHIEIQNYEQTEICNNALSGIIISMSSSWSDGEVNNYHVFYDVDMDKYRVSNWPPSCESGAQGITIEDGVDHIWILDSFFNEIAEDAIHIIGYHGRHDVSLKRGPHNGLPNYIYIGNNHFYKCGENAVDIKESNHVIVSSNTGHYFRPTRDFYGWGGAVGQAIVINNEGESNITGDETAKNTWIIFNKFYDLGYGIYDESGNSSYLIGNIIYDFVDTESRYSVGIQVDKSNAQSSNAVEYIVNNTIVNPPDYGIYIRSAYDIYCDNNIIYELKHQDKWHFRTINVHGTRSLRNNLFYDNEEVRVYGGLDNCDHCLSNVDPLFTDLRNNNFILQSSSPAIDAGVESDVYDLFYSLYGLRINKDKAGTLRPQGSAWDIGAYEYVLDTYADEDVNQDGQVNISDVQLVVNVILGNATNSRADVNGDGSINIQDVQAVVNEIVE